MSEILQHRRCYRSLSLVDSWLLAYFKLLSACLAFFFFPVPVGYHHRLVLMWLAATSSLVWRMIYKYIHLECRVKEAGRAPLPYMPGDHFEEYQQPWNGCSRSIQLYCLGFDKKKSITDI